MNCDAHKRPEMGCMERMQGVATEQMFFAVNWGVVINKSWVDSV